MTVLFVPFLLCRLCSSRHFLMTQQLTHLLCKHTLTHTHSLIHTRCSLHLLYRGRLTRHWNHVLWSSLSSSPAYPAHTLSLCTDSTSWFCLSTHLPVFRSFSSSSSYSPLHTFSHTPPWEDNFLLFYLFFWFFKKNSLHTPLRPISALLMFFHVAVPTQRESSPAGAHYRRAWSWLPGSRLICHIPVPSCCWAQQIESVVKCVFCVYVCVRVLGAEGVCVEV